MFYSNSNTCLHTESQQFSVLGPGIQQQTAEINTNISEGVLFSSLLLLPAQALSLLVKGSHILGSRCETE